MRYASFGRTLTSWGAVFAVSVVTIAVAACNALSPDPTAPPRTVQVDGSAVTYQPTKLETGVNTAATFSAAMAPAAAAADPFTGGTATPIVLGVTNVFTLLGASIREWSGRKRKRELVGALLEIHKESPQGAPALVTSPEHKAVIAEVTGI